MSYRVLAAEDSPTQAAVLRAHLEGAGFHVSLAGNGAEALALMDDESFDLIISDVVMPDVGGYDLCRAVKERDPRVPVVLLTSLTDPLDVVNALAAGADNFLRKPYEPTELVHRVRNMLHNKELRDGGRAQMGLELFFLGRRFMINSDREQILDLLVSTFEDLVGVNERLRAREEELAHAHGELATRLAETELERDRLDAVLAAMPGGIAVVDANCTIVNANESLAELVGAPLASLRGVRALDAIPLVDHRGEAVPEDDQALAQSLCGIERASGGRAFELFLGRRDGTRVPVLARAEPILGRDGAVVGAVGTLEDLSMLMVHDPLTGLPGHGILVDRLRVAAEHEASSGVLVVVIDRFDRMRQNLPVAGYERVVATVADRLRRALDLREVQQRSTAASAAYLGDGEVALILPDIGDESDAVVIAEILAEHLAEPVDVDGVDVAVSVSIAVGMSDRDTEPEVLVASVAAAARRASADGGQRVATSDQALHGEVVDLLRREDELRSAITTGQLVTHYQPQIRLRDGRPVAVEALVRWAHPERGLLGAGEIIPLAVESGLISAVSWLVLEDACRQAAHWREHLPGAEALVMSVNLAAEQLAEPDVAVRIADILAATGLDPAALVLEITEGSVMADPDTAGERLTAIKALGAQVALDDFGTGYSSLLQLRRLPVDILKIDRVFVSGMLAQSADAAIVAGTLRLARALGLEVVAEGVETLDELVQLRVLGCDIGQGYHWARPMGADDLGTWWSEQALAPFGGFEVVGVVDTDERQDRAISYLVHELRSPLAAITGFAGLVEDSSPEPASGYASAILRSAHELEHRLDTLGEADDLVRGELTIDPEDLDVADLVRTLVDDLSPQLSPQAIDVSAPAPAVATVDPVRLRQAVTNLLVNAAKYGPQDEEIEVSVTAERGSVAISVRDHGPGVPEDRRHELFRRFSRLGSRTKGMGMGLYLARSIVEAHGGLVRHDHAPGGGAVFCIQLPAASQGPVEWAAASSLPEDVADRRYGARQNHRR
ncbi:MAG: EAL domain-containing protein [Acidimicrobiales bacterium]